MVTSRDIARLAGVSQSTVSRVLQNRPEVSGAVRARVQKVLDETGYTPNPAARAMRGTKTNVIGVVVGRITNPFYPELLESIGLALHKAGKRMLLWSFVHGGFEEEAVYGMRDQLVDGLIFTTASYGSTALKEALDRRAPIVLVNRSLDDVACDQLTSDHARGTKAAVRHLVELGHRRVGVLGGIPQVSTNQERRSGFIAELAQHGITVDAKFDVTSDATHDAAYAEAAAMLSEPDRPTALLCANDLLAFGAIDAARDLGIAVPGQLSIVGYDDIGMSSWPAYDLTTVRQPLRVMADVAVSMLLRRLDDPDLPFESRRYSPELMVRGSTGQAPIET
ncbi:substrate-binding domain-containing protein [Microbacterium ulmi]|uniref:LacI family DNA-binding transcriptional regulator n=1 Tax=Microbacterium ulmi TaxID=179095 RepID=A0A7Y2Q1G2_9MICO|nr:LacI family transcriptional regulator [Microbacterium ulmi]NNH03880.1 LacI family DNA-binding transcriptional regulator [Microbacterium ulmi]